MSALGQKQTSTSETAMSASLIGRLGSSAFRLSTTAVSMSLTGSCFSAEIGAKALPSWGSKTRWNDLRGGVADNCRQARSNWDVRFTPKSGHRLGALGCPLL
jgi:hypothetical protein